MSDQDRLPPAGGDFPPPPPPDEPTSEPNRGSIGWGVVLGFLSTAAASFAPLLLGMGGLLLLPAVLVIAIVLSVQRSTRQTGLGMLGGFAVGFIASAGTCVYLLSTADFG